LARQILVSARAEIIGNALLQRKSWTPAVRAAVELRATKDDFIVTAHLTAREGKMEIIARTWEEKIPPRLDVSEDV